MRLRIGIAAIVALVALVALAPGARAEDARNLGEEARKAATDAEERAGDAKREARDEQRDARQARDPAAEGEEERHVFEGRRNYDLEGRIAKVTKRSVTISREELPPVTLRLDGATAIEVDGEQAARTQLREGQEVRASFNVAGDRPVAVSLEVTSGRK